jgi:hypothetical protein
VVVGRALRVDKTVCPELSEVFPVYVAAVLNRRIPELVLVNPFAPCIAISMMTLPEPEMVGAAPVKVREAPLPPLRMVTAFPVPAEIPPAES